VGRWCPWARWSQTRPGRRAPVYCHALQTSPTNPHPITGNDGAPPASSTGDGHPPAIERPVPRDLPISCAVAVAPSSFFIADDPGGQAPPGVRLCLRPGVGVRLLVVVALAALVTKAGSLCPAAGHSCWCVVLLCFPRIRGQSLVRACCSHSTHRPGGGSSISNLSFRSELLVSCLGLPFTNAILIVAVRATSPGS